MTWRDITFLLGGLVLGLAFGLFVMQDIKLKLMERYNNISKKIIELESIVPFQGAFILSTAFLLCDSFNTLEKFLEEYLKNERNFLKGGK